MMHFLAALVSVAFWLPFTAADGGGQSGSVPAYPLGLAPGAPSNVQKDGVKQYVKALKKYNAQVPTHVQAPNAAISHGVIADKNAPQEDEEYLIPVLIGTPPQLVYLQPDSGSGDTWVFSSYLSSKTLAGHIGYNPDNSSTSRPAEGQTWLAQYGDGSAAKGNVTTDTMALGAVTAKSQAVELALELTDDLVKEVPTDGILGLSFSKLNTVRPNIATTFFDTVKSTLASPLFAAYLRHDEIGAFDIGALNSSHYKGSVVYSDVNTANGLWQISAGTYSVGTAAHGTVGDAILDTGTSLILAPPDVVENYYGQVQGARLSGPQGGFVYPCSTQLPDFSINIEGVTRTVPGSLLNYTKISNQRCFGGLQPNGNLPFSVLGAMFIKTQYVVFNGGDNPQIGMATQA